MPERENQPHDPATTAGGTAGSSTASAEPARVDRRYARFHRILGELLVRLGSDARTFWLTDDRHRIGATGTDNSYAKAVYVAPDLDRYEPALAELDDAQRDAMAAAGLEEPTQSLLTPKVCRDVRAARILTNTGFSSRARDRDAILDRFERQLQSAREGLEAFYGTPGREARVRELEDEIRELTAGMEALRQSGEGVFREHYRYPRYMCHVYYEDPDAFDQLYVGDVGVILQGRRADVERHQPLRRRHRRTEGVEPVAEIGPYVFYEESAWQRARADASPDGATG